MTDLLREVDEALRRERMEKFWQAHGRKVIIAVLVLLAGVGLFSAYEGWQRSVQEAHTESLIALLESPDFPSDVHEKTQDIGPGQRGIALLQAAARYRLEKKESQALELYQIIASDKAIPKTLRQQADLLRTATMAPGPEMKALMQPIADDTSSPWRPHALLNLAAYYAHEGQDPDQARALVDMVLAIESLPPSLMQRAQALAHVYDLKKPQTAKKDEKNEKS
ncbi:MAG: hypothetical protein L6Q57_01130 [Alphaproteobacteria bacterium]|nr:hypothetical protein [Alphaproteobacteria bacterium]